MHINYFRILNNEIPYSDSSHIEKNLCRLYFKCNKLCSCGYEFNLGIAKCYLIWLKRTVTNNENRHIVEFVFNFLCYVHIYIWICSLNRTVGSVTIVYTDAPSNSVCKFSSSRCGWQQTAHQSLCEKWTEREKRIKKFNQTAKTEFENN